MAKMPRLPSPSPPLALHCSTVRRDHLIIALAAAVALATATARSQDIPLPGPSVAFSHGPLRVSRNHRFLQHRDGTPFLYLGDTAWELFHRLTREDAERYLEKRRQQGFTVIQAVVLAEFDGLTVPNAYGDLPLVDGDPATAEREVLRACRLDRAEGRREGARHRHAAHVGRQGPARKVGQGARHLPGGQARDLPRLGTLPRRTVQDETRT